MSLIKYEKNENYSGKILEKRCKVTSKTGAKMSPVNVGLNGSIVIQVPKASVLSNEKRYAMQCFVYIF